ncbi:Pyridoxal 5'-phosphate synthase subunit PdxT [Paramicrosporidium saccamoebae]|uniref:glutaminase n=1 Tax=Paramicrosporidium saccamoebae TaxID=1246581 RepID=A0A2H9TLT9_9FUNG|nr:Pyridoxal 5'-phosphate synthase subunit PdxT [Paramicrosporidium saccamoebae]
MLKMNENAGPLRIGVLGMQGAVIEHEGALKRADESIEIVLVRSPDDVKNLDGLILPGGESTTISINVARGALLPILQEWIHAGRPTFGTCAGLILMSKPNMGGFDCTVERNYYGSQSDSFVTTVLHNLKELGPSSKGVFIRAPAIQEVSDQVTPLAVIDHIAGQQIVAIQQGNFLGTTFHPELTTDPTWHRYFLKIAKAYKKQALEAYQ